MVVDEPILRVLVADVELGLDGAGLAEDSFRAVAILQLEGGLVFGEVGVGLRAPRLDDGDFKAGLGEAFSGPAAGRARPDYENVKGILFKGQYSP